MAIKWRLALILIVGVAVGPLVFGAGASAVQAGGSWSAWLYNADTGRMVLVFPDGVPPTNMMFPLPPGTSTPPSTLTISRDGSLVAACLTDDSGSASVRVYDMYGGGQVAAYLPTGPVIGCSLARYSFSEDSTQLAFGLLNHWPSDPDSRPDWELNVMQMTTSAILYHLDSSMPQVTGLGFDVRGKLPFVETFQMASGSYPGLISFKPVQWGTEGSCEYPGVVWNLGNHTVYSGPNAGKVGLDYLLPNSEAIWSDTDSALPSGTLQGPGCAFNVVMYSNKMGDRYPIFNNGTVLSGPAFVDDGRKVAVSSTSGSVRQWIVIDRSGNTATLPADMDTYDVWGTLDGYVFLKNAAPGGAMEVHYHRFTSGLTPDAYVAWTAAPGDYWRIVWVNPISGGTGLPPFQQLTVLGPPPVMVTLQPNSTLMVPMVPMVTLQPGVTVMAPMVTLQPVITLPAPPAPVGVLAVGARATVNTTEGDMLRVRTGAGTSYAVAFQLPNGTGVTLLEGPVTGSGGLTWWRIQTDDGRSGWAVEGVNDTSGYLQTLLPAR